MKPIHLLSLALCLLTACSRSPQSASELLEHLPHRFGGELRVQGETGTRTLNVELLDLKVRDPHHVVFNRLTYEVSGGDEGSHRGEAPLKGTISAPGGEIQIEDASAVAGGDALKAGSFHGTLSNDLRSVDAQWKTGFDQTVSFEGKAAR